MENTPQKKADELVEKLQGVRFALIRVDGILLDIMQYPSNDPNELKFWQQVKSILQSKIT